MRTFPSRHKLSLIPLHGHINLVTSRRHYFKQKQVLQVLQAESTSNWVIKVALLNIHLIRDLFKVAFCQHIPERFVTVKDQICIPVYWTGTEKSHKSS